LQDLGYVDGKNIAFELRLSGGKPETFPGLVADLVQRKVDVLFAISAPAVLASKDATGTIPIVGLDLESDAVGAGFVRSFAQPGGNITGCFLDQAGPTSKWLELIGEVVPDTRRIAVLRDPSTGPWQLAAIKRAAEKLGIELAVLDIRSAGELDDALQVGVKDGSRALVQLSSPLFGNATFAARLADLTAKHRLPAISVFREFADAGGLMTYGPNRVAYYKRLPVYIDKILKGGNPADLPIEQPNFDLVVNLKTAKALGIAIPQSVLGRADVVIQ
jgi:putative ABC transport system substrate-binding protein